MKNSKKFQWLIKNGLKYHAKVIWQSVYLNLRRVTFQVLFLSKIEIDDTFDWILEIG